MLNKILPVVIIVFAAIVMIGSGWTFGHYVDKTTVTVYRTVCSQEVIPGSFTSDNGTVTYQGTRSVKVC